MGGTPLDEFEHPENAVYLLGSEDNGIPPRVLEACGACVALSAERYASYNVAMAGSIVLYDRLAKRRALAADGSAHREGKSRRIKTPLVGGDDGDST